MTDTEQLAYPKALDYATQKHCGQFRKGGMPYITHPIEVARLVRSNGYPLDFQLTALFHDLLEDTDATEKQIEDLSNQRVLEAVKLLTKTPHYQMEEYIRNIKANEIAFVVKAADRLHNLKSAISTDTEFKRKYIFETVDWYLDFSREIPPAVKALAQTLNPPITELSFIYEPIDTWNVT